MARRILIIVTRMYAVRGGRYDEFVHMWGQEAHLDHAIFPENPDARIVVLVHGYQGRFQGADVGTQVSRAVQQAIESLRVEITPADAIGILYHPRTRRILGRDDFSQLGRGIRFVKEYGSTLPGYDTIEELANNRNAVMFDKVWNCFGTPLLISEFLFEFLPLHLELQLKEEDRSPLTLDRDTCKRRLSDVLEDLQASPTDQQVAMGALDNIFNSIIELLSLIDAEKFEEKFKKFDNAYRALRDHLFSLLERVEAPLP